jgi:hypothetical protein
MSKSRRGRNGEGEMGRKDAIFSTAEPDEQSFAFAPFLRFSPSPFLPVVLFRFPISLIPLIILPT